MDKRTLSIIQLTELPQQLADLEREASDQGFELIARLIHEWATGVNRFDKVGERLLLVSGDENIVGIGGLNVDPYRSAGDTARLRRVYIATAFRRRGIGELLVKALLDGASEHFRVVRLSTDTAAAALFYERLGFVAVVDSTATHVKQLLE